MQDVASSLPARPVGAWLDDHFIGGWIGRRRSSEWPPGSPDLNPRDFVLWGWDTEEVQ